MIGEPVAIIHPGTRTDGYGNTLPSWDDATEVPVEGAAFSPAYASEENDRRAAVTERPSLYLPAGTAIDATCRVRIRGLVYEAIGDPADWRNPFTGWNAGLAIEVQRVEG